MIQNALHEHYTATTDASTSARSSRSRSRINDDISDRLAPADHALSSRSRCSLALQLLFSRTRLGRAFRATSDDPDARS